MGDIETDKSCLPIETEEGAGSPGELKSEGMHPSDPFLPSSRLLG